LAALYDAQTFDQFTAAEQSARSLKGPTYRRLPGANDKCLLKSFLNVGNKFHRLLAQGDLTAWLGW
jgi:hypothetical protein